MASDERDEPTKSKQINSRIFLQNLLGHRVVCTLTDGRTATGDFECVDRL
jgi:small nuclear ribonucleoprotein (snRNP)-like protein